MNEVLIAIHEENKRVCNARWRYNLLREAKHGHQFGDNRQCCCGMTDIEYALNGYKERKPCSQYSSR